MSPAGSANVSAAGGGPSRRRFLGSAAGFAVAGSAAALAACTSSSDRHAVAPTTTRGTGAGTAPGTAAAGNGHTARVPAAGTYQAGVVTPLPPQPQLLSAVFDLSGDPARVLADVGRTVLALTDGTDPRLAGLEPGDLTVTIGVGPRLVREVDASLPGAARLPAFRTDHLTERTADGDVLVQVCATDPLVLPAALTAVAATRGLRERWQQAAFRGPNVRITGDAYAPRNLLGFVDGIIGPRTGAQFDADVWLRGPGDVAHGSIVVVRRMEIDLERFLAQSVRAQQDVIGRRRTSAAPLSGGTIATDPDLGAKTPTGAYLIPAAAHLRRANPASTGVPPMLRRSYSFTDQVASGLFFVSFQNSLQTFVATMSRMSTLDALLDYVTTTRSGSFLVLPGFDAGRPLGSTLFR